MRSETVQSACYVTGISVEIQVSVSLRPGLPVFSIIGLPDRLVREARERVKAGLSASGVPFPKGRVTVSLSPAALPKAGTQFDLAIAAAILKLTGAHLPDARYLGELLPNGKVILRNEHLGLEVSGSIVGNNMHTKGMVVLTLENLVKQVFETSKALPAISERKDYLIDQIIGLQSIKRSLLIAMAGRHSVLLTGAAGVGKSLLAKAFAQLLPRHTAESAYRAALWRGRLGLSTPQEREIITPAVGISEKELFGRSTNGAIGQLASAVEGMLFFDEISLARADVLARLRLPLEEGLVEISTENGLLRYPIAPIVWAATNNCLCGNLGLPGKVCSCTAYQIAKYRTSLSAPLLERFAMHLSVPSEIVTGKPEGEGHLYAAQVSKCWGNMTQPPWSKEAKEVLLQGADRFHLSPRVQKSTEKICETIATIDGLSEVGPSAVLEALQYRPRNPGTKPL